jgi:hypothetical protein
MTLRDALNNPGWRKALQSKYDALIQNKTWELVPLPSNCKALSARWVLWLKPDMHATYTRLKVFLVAKGYEQKYGIDYDENFAPVLKWSTLQLIIAIASCFGWPLVHLDVITAFLNGKLTEVIYMHQPPGYAVKGKENLVCRLLRSLYGLKQSPRTWYKEIDCYLQHCGWHQSSGDPSLYFPWKNQSIVILVIYVNDLLITGNDPVLIAHVKDQLQTKYCMKDLGALERYLGVQVHRSSTGVHLNQQDYALQILQDAKLQDCNSATVPLPPGTALSEHTDTLPFDQFQYFHVVGQLLYLTNTRPDLAYSVNYVSRFMSNPQVAH